MHGAVPSSKLWDSFVCAEPFDIRGWRMPRPEDHLVSPVREIRMHGVNECLANSQSLTGHK